MGLSFNDNTNCQLTRDNCYKSNKVTKVALLLIGALFLCELLIGLKHEIILRELKNRDKEYKQYNLQFESEDNDVRSWISSIWSMSQYRFFGKKKINYYFTNIFIIFYSACQIE